MGQLGAFLSSQMGVSGLLNGPFGLSVTVGLEAFLLKVGIIRSIVVQLLCRKKTPSARSPSSSGGSSCTNLSRGTYHLRLRVLGVA
jgi:hypothetical protein